MGVAGATTTGSTGGGSGSGGNGGGLSGAMLDSGVGSVPFGIGWAQVGNIAFEVGLAFVPFAGAIRSAANGDIKGAVLEGLFDLATMGTGGPLKAAVKGAAALAYR